MNTLLLINKIMNVFERSLFVLTGGLKLLENDPGFGYRVYKLNNVNNARFFRMQRRFTNPASQIPQPKTGFFVEATSEKDSQRIELAYCSLAANSDGSQYHIHAKLSYDLRELNKAKQHVSEFLSIGRIPIADGEYANEGEYEY